MYLFSKVKKTESNKEKVIMVMGLLSSLKYNPMWVRPAWLLVSGLRNEGSKTNVQRKISEKKFSRAAKKDSVDFFTSRSSLIMLHN